MEDDCTEAPLRRPLDTSIAAIHSTDEHIPYLLFGSHIGSNPGIVGQLNQK
jgi:hypothetical protein